MVLLTIQVKKTTMEALKDKISGNWKLVSGKIKSRWGQITDDELLEMEGKADQVAGFIQKKTGESEESVNKFLEELKL